MKTIQLIIILFVLLTGTRSIAQHVKFATEGVIEFERSTNVYAIIQKRLDQDKNNTFSNGAFEQLKKTNPQFRLSKSTLYFSKDKTLFTPVEGDDQPLPFFDNYPSLKQINTVYTDLSTRQQITRKAIFEENFLIKDTARVINWKITDERREIAGYPCRRANALIMDSIYVVAFYTDQIPVSGGPESFTGLPGMILGVALPHENLSWFAKTVTDKPIEAKLLAAPTKGKPTDKKGLVITLNKVLKDWGSSAKSWMKDYML